MSFWEVILLGIVQGIAEFLPISSSGHLVVLESLFGGSLENLELNVALHFGTLLSIVVVYRNDLLPVLKQPKLLLAIVVATLPVVASGLLLKDVFVAASATPVIAGIGLLITSGLLAITPKVDRGDRSLGDIRLRDALVIGLFQAIAPLPGISRSGSTIVGALLMGLRREAAGHFSFFIAIPALSGATILTMKDILDEGTTGTPIGFALAGAGVAFVVGVFALKWLLRLISAGKLAWFSIYCFILGAVVVLASLLNVL